MLFNKWKTRCEELQRDNIAKERAIRYLSRELDGQKELAAMLEASLDATTNTLATARGMAKHHQERAAKYKLEAERQRTRAEMLEELFRKAETDGFCTICAEGKSLEECGGVCNFRYIGIEGNPSTAGGADNPSVSCADSSLCTREPLKEEADGN